MGGPGFVVVRRQISGIGPVVAEHFLLICRSLRGATAAHTRDQTEHRRGVRARTERVRGSFESRGVEITHVFFISAKEMFRRGYLAGKRSAGIMSRTQNARGARSRRGLPGFVLG